MNKQKDLEGEIAAIEPEEKTTTSLIYTADFFKVSVPESVDLSEKNSIEKRTWISKHMRPHRMLPAGKEGEVYQKDLNRLSEVV